VEVENKEDEERRERRGKGGNSLPTFKPGEGT